MILGITGRARAGKDTLASIIKQESGVRVSRWQIADPLKAYCRDLFGWTEEHTDGGLKEVQDKRYSRPCVRHPRNPKPGYINTAIDIMGYSTPHRQRWQHRRLAPQGSGPVVQDDARQVGLNDA